MKRIITMLLLVVAVCGLTGCEKKAEVTINYGNSTLYSEEDMNEAIKLIQDELNSWDGCELHSISYSSDDECNSDNIAWMNDLKDDHEVNLFFSQCIMFESSFHSPKKGGGAWEADEEYTWQWWLARSDGGSWRLMTWGYC